MNVFIPHDMILKAQKAKYKYLALPALIIIINFFLKNQFESVKYLSILALIVYGIILILFRFRRTYPKHDENNVIAPINGKIIHKKCLPTGCILTIQKPAFASSEIVTCTKTDIPKVLEMDKKQVSWQIEGSKALIFIDEPVSFQTALIGLAPGPAICEVFIPSIYNLLVEEGNSVEAGLSIIAEKTESTSEMLSD